MRKDVFIIGWVAYASLMLSAFFVGSFEGMMRVIFACLGGLIGIVICFSWMGD